MLKLFLVLAPIVAAVSWVLFNIAQPAKDQWSRDYGSKN